MCGDYEDHGMAYAAYKLWRDRYIDNKFSENCDHTPNKEKDQHPPQVAGLSFALINKG